MNIEEYNTMLNKTKYCSHSLQANRDHLLSVVCVLAYSSRRHSSQYGETQRAEQMIGCFSGVLTAAKSGASEFSDETP